MKKIKYITIFTLLLTFIGCSEDFLERKSLTTQADENYYSNPEQIAEALTAAYSKLTNDAGANNYNLTADIMSDDRLGGGGINDIVPHDADQQTNSVEDTWLEMWQTQYEGIFRVNMIISRFEQAVYTDDVLKNRDLGEAYFLRGYFYLRLALMFGQVPVITDPAPVNYPKATPEELFAQIASDLKMAIELMPNLPVTNATYYDLLASRNGHTSKWTAEGIMARAFLFYTGYYNQTTMPLTDGGTITSTQVVDWLEDCIENSGYELLDDPRELWPYTAISDPDYPDQYSYNDTNDLHFAGDGNAEIMFMVKYASFANFNLPNRISYSNQGILYQGLRMNAGLVPFGNGWGFGPVNPQIWETFETGDIRQQGFILSFMDDLPDEQPIADAYVWGGELSDPQQDETGYWSKKGMPTVLAQGEYIRGYYYVLYGGNENMQLWNMQDDPILRFADVMLMAAELGSSNAQTYMDAIRSRAGLGSVAPTLENIKLERRHEFFGEGLRYHDLLRWHDAEAAFATATNITAWTGGVQGTYTVTFDPDKAFLKIPESQIRLADGVLEQNPGWE